MPRKPNPTPDNLESGPFPMTKGLAEVAAETDVVHRNVATLAEQLGYEGSLTVGALEDEIRFYQRRSVEALLAVGTRLLLLKEMTPHGQFMRRVELLGFNERTARRFMQAAFKTSKSANLAVLAGHIDGSGKFLELITLDDDDLAELAEGGSVAGLTLDNIDTMSASELRATLRARDKLLKEKTEKINDLAVQVEKATAAPKRKTPLEAADYPEQILGLSDDLHALGKVMDEVLSKHLTLVDATELVYAAMPEGDPAHDQYKAVVFRMGEQIERLCTLAAGVRHHYEITLSGYVALDKTYTLPDD